MAARTLTEIIAATRQAWIDNVSLQELYSLDPTKTFEEQFSVVSLESLLTYIFSYIAWLYESIVDNKAADVLAAIDARQYFTIPWYHASALAFQIGDELVYDDNTFRHGYVVVDESKRIIKYTTIRQRLVEGVTKLQVFAAKANKTAMSADELAAFSAYIVQVGAAGTHFQFISLSPDQRELNLTVYYNPQILSSSGLKLSDSSSPVDGAINAHLDAIKYAGAFNRNKLVDAVQLADGVQDVVLGDVRLNGDLKNDREFESESGFYTAQTINVTYLAYAG